MMSNRRYEQALTRQRLLRCSWCDLSGLYWREGTYTTGGPFVAYDDPRGDTGFRCWHHAEPEQLVFRWEPVA